jgi:hypothetical protein
MSTAWSRLVRYQAVADGPVQFGEPIIAADSDDIASLALNGRLQVKVCEGEDPFTLQVTNRTETVFRLLGPLAPKHVPIIRCIGLNYKSHSKDNDSPP